MNRPWMLAFIHVIAIGLVSTHSLAQADQLHSLRDAYQNKPLVLRGFYSGDVLHYDSSGSPVGSPTTGDWTTDGIVQLDSITIADNHLSASGNRLIVISYDNVFQFFVNHKLGRDQKPPRLAIEIDLLPSGASEQEAAIAFSKIFLTSQDSFRDLVPEYWKYCVQDALSDSDEHCHFAKEFMAIPGFALGERHGLWDGLPKNPVTIMRPGFSPARLVSLDRGCLTDSARNVKYRGVVDFVLVIDSEGRPSNVRILAPVGFGIDARAARALESSKWKPAEISGRPTAIVLTTQVDCTR